MIQSERTGGNPAGGFERGPAGGGRSDRPGELQKADGGLWRGLSLHPQDRQVGAHGAQRAHPGRVRRVQLPGIGQEI